jgi:hypothetical protein
MANLEELHMKHMQELQQAHNRHRTEVKAILDSLDDLIEAKVEHRMRIHLESIGPILQRIEAKLEQHFGS